MMVYDLMYLMGLSVVCVDVLYCVMLWFDVVSECECVCVCMFDVLM